MRTSHWYENGCLPALGLMGRTLGWFPLWLLVGAWHRRDAAIPLGIYAVLFVGGGCLTLLATRRDSARQHGKRLRQMACLMGMGLLAVGMVWLLLDGLGAACAVGLTVMMLLAAWRTRLAEPEEYFALPPFVAFLTGHTLVAALLALMDLQPPMPPLLLVCGIEMACFLLLRNQYLLLRLVNRRSPTARSVPRDIRAGNLRLVLLVLGGFGLLFALAPIWGRLLQAMGTGALWVVRQVLRLLRQLFHTAGGAPPADGSEAPMEEEPLPLPNATASPLWSLLWLLLLPIAYYIWRLFLRDVWFDGIDRLRSLWKRLRRPAPVPTVPTADAPYLDWVTDCRPTETQTRRTQNTWQKAYRQWRKTADTPEKFFAGYRLLTTAPALADAWLTPSDTVREILQKCRTCGLPLPLVPLSAVTAAYQAVQYAAAPFSADALPELSRALAELAAQSKGKPIGSSSCKEAST